MGHLEENRENLTLSYPVFSNFRYEYLITDEFIEELYVYAEKDGLERNEEEILQSEDLIKVMMKAFLARNLYDMNAYYETISVIDDGLIRATEVINDKKYFKENKINHK
jgi:carboxyl-terminal processing protease